MGGGSSVVLLLFFKGRGALEAGKGSDVREVQYLGNWCCINMEGECH